MEFSNDFWEKNESQNNDIKESVLDIQEVKDLYNLIDTKWDKSKIRSDINLDENWLKIHIEGWVENIEKNWIVIGCYTFDYNYWEETNKLVIDSINNEYSLNWKIISLEETQKFIDKINNKIIGVNKKEKANERNIYEEIEDRLEYGLKDFDFHDSNVENEAERIVGLIKKSNIDTKNIQVSILVNYLVSEYRKAEDVDVWFRQMIDSWINQDEINTIYSWIEENLNNLNFPNKWISLVDYVYHNNNQKETINKEIIVSWINNKILEISDDIFNEYSNTITQKLTNIIYDSIFNMEHWMWWYEEIKLDLVINEIMNLTSTQINETSGEIAIFDELKLPWVLKNKIDRYLDDKEIIL